MNQFNFHAIAGPNGMCECGVRADGTVVTCAGLLEAYVQERLTADRAERDAALRGLEAKWREQRERVVAAGMRCAGSKAAYEFAGCCEALEQCADDLAALTARGGKP